MIYGKYRVDFYEGCIEQLKTEIPKYLNAQKGKILNRFSISFTNSFLLL